MVCLMPKFRQGVISVSKTCAHQMIRLFTSGHLADLLYRRMCNNVGVPYVSFVVIPGANLFGKLVTCCQRAVSHW